MSSVPEIQCEGAKLAYLDRSRLSLSRKTRTAIALIIIGASTAIPLAHSYLLPMTRYYSPRHEYLANRPAFLPPTWLQAAKSSSSSSEYIRADDMEALQSLFESYTKGKDGLMTKSELAKVSIIAGLLNYSATMLDNFFSERCSNVYVCFMIEQQVLTPSQSEGDLMQEELDDIFDKAPKFPDDSDRIDVDSFVQIYRDIDDLFEDEDEVSESKAEQEEAEKGESDDDEDGDGELESMFYALMDDKGLVTKKQLFAWEELSQLMDEGLISRDEAESLWIETQKGAKDPSKMDLAGFLKFNEGLDQLFDFDDEGVNEEEINAQLEYLFDGASNELVTEEEGMDPKDLFVALKNDDGFVTMSELNNWSDLQDMLAEGDLLSSELESIFNTVADESDNLNEKAFLDLYQMIDELFEEETEAEEETETADPATEVKADLLSFLDELNDVDDELPCGLESTEEEQREILELCNELQASNMNLVRSKKGAIDATDLEGTWELLYTSSSAMKFNKGLSGLGGSFPNGRFGGLKQRLVASKYMADAEYTERIEVTPSSASFDVKVSGDWDLRSSISLFSGEPSIILTVQPDRVEYGPTSTRADHWKSLGPMNSLDIAYLDDELRIMRGNTSLDTVFILRRVK